MGEVHSKELSKNQNNNLQFEENKIIQNKKFFNEINTNPKKEEANIIKQKISNDNNKKILNQINNDFNNDLNNINFPGVTGGNRPKIDESQNILENLKTEPDAMSEDFRPRKRFKRIVDIKKEKEKPILKKKNYDMANKLPLKKNLNINPNRNENEIKVDPMMITADNLHSKKIVFPIKKEEPIKKNEIKENLIPKKVEDKNKKKDSPIKNVISQFKNVNENKNKNLVKKRFSRRRIHEINYNRENFNTINNEEEQISLNKRHNQILNREILTKPKKPIINIDENINNRNNENKIYLNSNNGNQIINNKIKFVKIEELPIKNIDNLNLNINKATNKIESIKKQDKNEEDDLESNININNLNKENKNQVIMKSNNINSKKDVIPIKKEEPIKKKEIQENLIQKRIEGKITKNVIFKTRNINENEDINKMKKNFSVRNFHSNYYNRGNFNTINNQEEQISSNKRHNQIINRMILNKQKKPIINIDDNLDERNNENKINLNNEQKINIRHYLIIRL